MVSDKTFTDAGVGRLLFTFATIVLPANSSINLNCNFHVISTLKLKNDLPVVPSLTEEIHMVFSIKENFLVLRSIGNFAWIFAQTQIRNQVNEATKGRHIVKVRNNASLKVITLFQHYKLKDAYLFYLPCLVDSYSSPWPTENLAFIDSRCALKTNAVLRQIFLARCNWSAGRDFLCPTGINILGVRPLRSPNIIIKWLIPGDM